MNGIINWNSTEMTAEYKEAMKTHQRILANGEICAQSLLEICKDLKKMRDEKLYEEFGYATFDEYSEKAVGIKTRQAYTYISTYERLGGTVLQSNASLGITKLDLIAQINPIERNEKLEGGEFAEMSVAEIKELVKKCSEQGEQISMLTEKLSDNKDDEDTDIENELAKALDEIECLKEYIKENEKTNGISQDNAADTADLLADEKEKIRKELDAEYARAQKEQICLAVEKERQKIEKERQKEIEAAKKTAVNEAIKAANEKISLLEQSEAQAKQHTAKLQQELALSDSKSAEAKVYINSLQEDFNKLFEIIAEMPDEQANRFKGACSKLLHAMRHKCEGDDI